MQNSLPSDFLPDERFRLIVDSYRRLTGKVLIEDAPDGLAALGMALWQAPRAIVAHGTEDDPVFFYGNRLALQLFEMSFDEFARLPSRLSAEPLAQESREKALAKVTQQGFVEGYSGARIASSGRRFMISNTTIWNLTDEAGVCHGQAAVFVEKK
jgi:hypothetical protein